MNLAKLPGSDRFAGIATTAELAAAGLTDARIRTLVRSGVLDPVCRGAYARADLAARARAAGARSERMLAIAAAIAVAGGPAAASHHDAAIVHGLDLLQRPPRGDVLVGLTQRPPWRSAVPMPRPRR